MLVVHLSKVYRRAATLLLAAAIACAGGAVPWFSHKQHAGLDLACLSCHQTAQKSVRAGMPAASRCLTCHRFKFSSPRPFQAEYDNLPDYVIFSHAVHGRARVDCEACHGKVNGQDRTEPAQTLNMPACLKCHEARGARTNCKLCHKLMS